jgi:hypothetical protein
VGVSVGHDDRYVIGDALDLCEGGWTAHAADREHNRSGGVVLPNTPRQTF